MGLLVPLTMPATQANHGPHSFYFHDPAYNVTAEGTYELVLNGTETDCHVFWNIEQGETSTEFQTLAVKLLFLTDCSPAFSLDNITAAPLAGPSGGTRTMDVIATHGDNTLQHRMEWYWSGTIEDGPRGTGLAAKASSTWYWWLACQDCPSWWWENSGCTMCGERISSRAHSDWVNVWVDGFEKIDTRAEGAYGYPGKISCWGEKRIRNTFYPMEVKCEKLFYAPGDPVPPW